MRRSPLARPRLYHREVLAGFAGPRKVRITIALQTALLDLTTDKGSSGAALSVNSIDRRRRQASVELLEEMQDGEVAQERAYCSPVGPAELG